MSRQESPALGLRLWSDGDLPLLSRILGDAVMTAHLGGPENEEQLLRRQRRYLELAGTGRGRMFKIVAEAKHRFLHAFPSVDNAASNAIFRKVGFSLIEECDVEYPLGSQPAEVS